MKRSGGDRRRSPLGPSLPWHALTAVQAATCRYAGLAQEVEEMSLQTPPRPREADVPVESGAPKKRSWPIRAGAVLAVAVVVGLAVVLMRSADDSDRRRAAPVAPRNLETDREAVAGAWRGFVTAAVEANNPPDPSRAAEVRAYATGRAYESVSNAIHSNSQRGVILRFPPNSRAQSKVDVVSIDGDNAIARACDVDDGVKVEAATGKVLNSDVVTILTTAFFVREDGRWKVENSRVEQKWAGVAGCAAT